MNLQQAWYNRWAVFRREEKKGPGKGWWGPPKGTHGVGGQKGERVIPPARGEEGAGHSMGDRPPLSSFAEPVPEGAWSSWTVENYRKNFREHTGNYLDDGVPLEQAQDIAAHLDNWPKTGRPATFRVAEERIMVSTMIQEGEASALYDKHAQTITFSPRYKHINSQIAQHEFGHHLDRGIKTIKTSRGKTKTLPTMLSESRGNPVGDLIRKAHEKNRYPNYRGSAVELLPKAMMDLDTYVSYEKMGGHMAKSYSAKKWKAKYPELYEAIEITVGKGNMPERWQT